MPERFVEWVNDSYNILGYEAEECIGKSTEMFYASPEGYQKTGALLTDAIREGKDVVLTEVMLQRKNGELIDCLLSARFIQLGDERVVLTSFLDITEQLRIEKDF